MVTLHQAYSKYTETISRPTNASIVRASGVKGKELGLIPRADLSLSGVAEARSVEWQKIQSVKPTEHCASLSSDTGRQH